MAKWSTIIELTMSLTQLGGHTLQAAVVSSFMWRDKKATDNSNDQVVHERFSRLDEQRHLVYGRCTANRLTQGTGTAFHTHAKNMKIYAGGSFLIDHVGEIVLDVSLFSFCHCYTYYRKQTGRNKSSADIKGIYLFIHIAKHDRLLWMYRWALCITVGLYVYGPTNWNVRKNLMLLPNISWTQ